MSSSDPRLISHEELEPSEDGSRRYPWADGYYVFSEAQKIPCRCTVDCPRGCDGRCGCRACSLCFTVHADEAGLLSELPLHERPDYEALIESYGRAWPPRPQDAVDKPGQRSAPRKRK